MDDQPLSANCHVVQLTASDEERPRGGSLHGPVGAFGGLQVTVHLPLLHMSPEGALLSPSALVTALE